MRTSALLASLLLLGSSYAQTVVRPGENLQAAINATPSGGWVWIQGGGYAAVQIVDKSIALLADPPAVIDSGACNTTSLFAGERPAPVEARGSGTEWVGLWGIVTQGRLLGGGSCWGVAAPGVRVEGLSALYVFYSYLQADAPEIFWGEFADGAPGLHVARTPIVHLETSAIQGGTAAFQLNLYENPGILDGAPGIFAPGLRVTLVGSYVRGGSGDPSVRWYHPTAPTAILSSWGGFGGPGIIAAGYQQLGSTIEGGVGARIYWDWNWMTFLGQQPNGPGFVSG